MDTATTNISSAPESPMQSANVNATAANDAEADSQVPQASTLAGAMGRLGIDQPVIPAETSDLPASNEEIPAATNGVPASNDDIPSAQPNTPVTPGSADSLVDELWLLIIEQTDLEEARCLRLASKRFGGLCIEHLHRYVQMRPKLLNPQDETIRTVAGYFREYAWTVSVNQELDWDLLIEELAEYKALNDLRWSYFTPVNFRSLTSLPAQVATALRTNTKLARIGLHIRAENGQLPRRKLSSVFIPAGNLKALNLSIPILEGDRVEFWASAGKLRHLRLAGGTRINFSAGPTSLSYLSFGAGSYQFNLTTPWHLPKLTTLVLESIDLVRYFRTVPASTFPNLRTLRVFCSILGSAPPPPLYQDLVAFIEKFSTLVEIDFGGTHDVTMTSKAIARHGATLRRLDLGRVLPQSRDLKQNLKASIVSHLELIAHSCSNLKTLVLEASVLVVIGDRQSYTPLELAIFPPLETLGLFKTIHSVEIKIQYKHAKMMWDKDNGMQKIIKDRLRLFKQGVAFSRIKLDIREFDIRERIISRRLEEKVWRLLCVYAFFTYKSERVEMISEETEDVDWWVLS